MGHIAGLSGPKVCDVRNRAKSHQLAVNGTEGEYMLVGGKTPRPLEMRNYTRRKSLLAMAMMTSAVASVFGSMKAWGQTLYWDINGASTGATANANGVASGIWDTSTFDWSTDSNGAVTTTSFTNSTNPTAVVFSAGTNATGASTVTLGTNVTVGALTIEEGTVSFNSTTSTLSLIGTTPAITVNGVASGIFNNVIAGSFGLTKLGPGSLTLAGFNTYTGATTISAGTLKSGVNNSLPMTTRLKMGTGATLDLRGFNQTIAGTNGLVAGGSITSTGGGVGTLTVNDSVGSTYAGNISGSLALNKLGTGILALSGSNTYSGGTMIAGGTLAMGVANAIPATSVVALNSGSSVFDLVGFNQSIQSLSGTFSGAMVTNSGAMANLAVNVPTGGEASAIYSGIITGNITLVSNGASNATQMFNQPNTYTGATVINSGSLYFNAANGIPVGSPVFIGANGSLNLGGLDESIGALSGSGNIVLSSSTLTVSSASDSTHSGVINSGGNGVVKSGSGTLTLAGTAANSYSCNTTVSGGTLALGKTAGIAAVGGNVVVNSGGTLLWLADEQIPDTAGLTLNSGGTINLNGHTETISSFTDLGGTKIYGSGVLNVSSGDLTVTDGTNISSGITLSHDLIYTGTTTVATISGGVTLDNGVANHNFNIANGLADPDTIISGAITGTSSFTKTGAGTLELSGTGSSIGGAMTVSAGTVKITGGSFTTGDGEFINGVSGAAVVQSGGTQNINNTELFISSSAGSSGTYNISGGQLNVGSRIWLGFSGTGNFAQSGGTVTAQFLDSTPLTGSVANYTLSGGSLNITGASISESLGDHGTSTFVQTGGSHTTTSLYMAFYIDGTSSYSLSNTGNLAVNGGEYIGVSGHATFTQSGGTHSISNASNFYIGWNGGATGSYNLSGGTLTADTPEFVGYSGNGTFSQSGGNNAITSGYLSLGAFTGSSGTYNITGGTFSAPNAYIGGISSAVGDTGVLNISGGAMTINGTVKVWNSASRINLSGGTLSMGTLDLGGTPSRLNWTSGTLAFTNTPVLTLNSTGVIGASPNLGAGFTLNTNNAINVPATGIFNVHGGNVSAGSMVLTGTSASLSTGTIAMGGYMNVGSGASATMSQSGGTFSLTGGNVGISLGMGAGITGTHILTGGTINNGGAEVIGNDGVGTYIQSGGSNAMASLLMANAPGGSGSATLNNGSLSAGAEFLGMFGNGSFTQTGGTHSAGTIYTAYSTATAISSYFLTGGSLNVSGDQYVGYVGRGSFNQAAGAVSIARLHLGYASGSIGSYTLGAGTLATPIAEYIGESGTGTFVQNGGTHTMFNLYDGVNSGAAGTVNQSGGAATMLNLMVALGTGSTGTYNISGGSLFGSQNAWIGGQNPGAGGAGGAGGLNVSGGWTSFAGAITLWNSPGSYINVTGGTLAAAGSITLNNSATFAGSVITPNLTVAAGTTNVTAGNVLATTMNVNVASGANLAFAANVSPAIASLSGAGNVTVSAGPLTIGSTGNFTFAGNIAGAGSLVKSGASTMVLSGTANQSGGITVAAGTLALGASERIADTTSVVVSPGGVLGLAGFNETIASLTGSGLVSLQGGRLTVGASQNNTFGGTIEGSGAFIKSGSATLTLTGTSTYTGPTSLVAGTLAISNGDNIGAGTLVFAGGKLQTAGGFSTSRDIAFQATTTIDLQNTANVTFSGAISGPAGFTKMGAGTLMLSGTSTQTGGITVAAGTLAIAAANVFGNSPANVEIQDGATLQTTSSLSTTRNFVLAAGAPLLDVAASTTASFNGILSGSGSLNKTGLGILVLGMANTYNGPTKILAGTLTLAAAGALPQSPVTISAGASLDTGGISLMFPNVGGSGGIILSGNNTLTFNSLGNTTYAGWVTGTGSLIKSGGSTFVLTSNSSYTGSTTVSAGTLQLGVANALPTTTTLTIDNGGRPGVPAPVFDLNGFAQTIGGLAGNGIVTNSATSPCTLTIDNSSAASFGGTINGPLSLTKTSSGTQSLTGVLSFNGPVNVSAGTLVLTAANTFTGNVNVSGSGAGVSTPSDAALGAQPNLLTISNNGRWPTTGTFSTGRAIAIGSGGGIIDVLTATTLTLNSTLAGTASLTKSGYGTLQILAPTTLSSSLNVLQGALRIASGGTMGCATLTLATNTLLELNNANVNIHNRLPDSADVVLAGGTFTFIGADNTASHEVLGRLIPQSGGSAINLIAGANGSTAVTFSGGLATRGAGATLDVVGGNLGSTNTLILSGQSAGALGSWATANSADYAKYSSTLGVIPFAASDYAINGFTPNSFVKLDPSLGQVPGTAPATTIKSLNLTASSSINLAQNGNLLTLSQGGLLKTGNSTATISGGFIASPTDELDVFVAGTGDATALRIASQITQAAGFTTALVKAGPGTLILGNGVNDTAPNTYGGLTYLNGGTLKLDKADGTIAIPAGIAIGGGNLVLLRPNQIATGAAVTLASGSFQLNGQSNTIANLTISGGDFNTGTGNLFIGDQTQPPILGANGVIVAALSSTAGTLTLNAGSATVDAGGTVTATTLVVSGGTNTVSAGGILKINQTSTFANGASLTLNAGATPGKLIVSSDVFGSPAATTASIVSSGAGSAGIVDLNGSVSRSFNITAGAASLTSSTPDLTISANISNGGLRKDGDGVLRFSAANSYTGTTSLVAGTLEITDPGALGSGNVSFSSGKLKLRSDATSFAITNPMSGASITLDYVKDTNDVTAATFTATTLSIAGGNFNSTGSSSSIALKVTGTTTLSGASAVNFYNSSTLELAGVVSGGTAGISKSYAGTLIFSGSGSNTYGGTTSVNKGTLLLNKSASAIAIPGNVTINDGILKLGAAAQIATSSAITLIANGGQSPNLQLNGFNQTLSALTFNSGGTVSTDDGNFSPTYGTLSLLGNVTYNGAVSATTANMTGKLNLGTSPRTFMVADGSATTDLAISADISGSGGLIKDGLGTMSLTGNSNFTGGVTINGGGTLTINSEVNLGSLANTITINNGTLVSNGMISQPVVLTGTGAAMRIESSNATTWEGAITGTSGFTKSGTGTLVLAVNNAFAGNVSVAAGTLSADSDTRLGGASSAIRLAGGNLRATATFNTPRSLTIASSSASIDVSGGNTFGITGALAGTAALTKTGAGTLNITGGQTWGTSSTYAQSTGVTTFGSDPGSNLSVLISGGTVNFTALASVNAISTTSGALNASSSVSTKSLTAGSVTLNAPSLLNVIGGAGAAINIPASTALSVSGNVAFSATSATVSIGTGSSITLASGATLTAGGSVDPFSSGVTSVGIATSLSSTFAVTSGTKNINTLTGSGATNVSSGATLITSSLTQDSLSLSGTMQVRTGHLTEAVNALTMGASGKLDLNDNNLIVNYTGTSPATTIRQLLINGYGPGNWSGTSGISSTVANADPTLHHTLGYAEASALGLTMLGNTSIPGNAVVVKYTYPGDSNLDGVVDLDNDFSLFVAGYNNQISNPGVLNSGNLWINGDYNYDGVVDLDNDFSLFVASYAAFQQNPIQLAQLNSIVNSMDLTIAQKNRILSAVPEPGSMALLATGAGMLAMRRRRVV